MTEAEVVALLTSALPALISFVDSKVNAGKASAELAQSAKDIASWFESAKFDLSDEVTAAKDADDIYEAEKFPK